MGKWKMGFASEKDNVTSHYLNESMEFWEVLKWTIKLGNNESLTLECLEEGSLCEVVGCKCCHVILG